MTSAGVAEAGGSTSKMENAPATIGYMQFLVSSLCLSACITFIIRKKLLKEIRCTTVQATISASKASVS